MKSFLAKITNDFSGEEKIIRVTEEQFVAIEWLMANYGLDDLQLTTLGNDIEITDLTKD